MVPRHDSRREHEHGNREDRAPWRPALERLEKCDRQQEGPADVHAGQRGVVIDAWDAAVRRREALIQRVDEAKLHQEPRRRCRQREEEDQGNTARDQERVAGQLVDRRPFDVEPDGARDEEREEKPEVNDVEDVDEEGVR